LVNYFSQPDIGNISERVAAGFVSFYWGGAMLGRFIGSALLNGVKTMQMAICSAVAGLLLIIPRLMGGHVVLNAYPRVGPFLSSILEVLEQGRPLILLCLIVLVLLLLVSALKGGRVSMRDGNLLGLAGIFAALLVAVSMLTFGHIAMWSITLVGFFNSIMFPSIFTLAIEGLGPLTGDGSGLLVAAIVGGAILPEVQGIIADRIGIHHAFFIPILCYLYIMFYAFVGSRRKDSGLSPAS
jgi:fucose permease